MQINRFYVYYSALFFSAYLIIQFYLLLLCLSTGYLFEAFNFESASTNKTNCQRWSYKKKGMLSTYNRKNIYLPVKIK